LRTDSDGSSNLARRNFVSLAISSGFKAGNSWGDLAPL
jgi:hypothetical protein